MIIENLKENYRVYIHKNKLNNKVYVGITSKEVKRRWKRGTGYKKQPFLYNAICKYGWENFLHIILYEGLTKEQAEQKEIELIAQYKSNQREYGYNIANGGSCLGKHSEESKIKMSEKRKGIIFTKEHIENLKASHIGQYPTKEQNIKNMMSNPRRREVICIETNIIYNSIREAGRETGINFKRIGGVCNKKYGAKTAGGYHWDFVDEFKIKNNKGRKQMKLYSNEIVFKGHPDKTCDQIAGALLKEYILQDKNTRAGIEVCGGKGKIFITGEITSSAIVDVESITKRVLKDVGYSADYEIINNLGSQSQDIAQGVDIGGAGDQGMMFGYACDDTPQLLPTAMVILQEFAKEYDRLVQLDKNNEYRLFFPDGKAQITGEYDDDFKLVKIKDFTVSYQNAETHREHTDSLIKGMVIIICNKYNIKIDNFHINPTGKFLIGGFEGDSGLTGRKIVVDAYQSFANVGGGNFNGKDPSKVDFSAAHKARQIACDYLRKYNLKWCEVQLSYSIGIAEPMAIYINSNIGELDADEKLYDECKPNNIIRDLKLKELDFEELAKFGHFR